MQVCTGCKILKPFDDFNRSKRFRDGYHCRCKACAKEERRLWIENNPETYRALKDKGNAKVTAWAKANPEAHAKRCQEWKKKNREKNLAYQRRNYQRRKLLKQQASVE